MRTGLDFGSERDRDSRKAARTVKFRIMVLMFLLLAVVLAMKEAGKPERWMWMGFDKIDQSPSESDFLVDARNGSAEDPTQGAMDWTIAKSAPSRSIERGGRNPRDEGAIGLSAAELGQHFGNELDKKFWQAAYRRFSDERQLQLFGLLRKILQSNFCPSTETDATALKQIIKRLEKEQNDFQTLALGEIALLSDEQQKRQRTATLFEFDRRWQTEVAPTLIAAVAGDDYSFGGQVEIRKVAQVLRPLFFDAVEDLAGMGTRSDLPGWMTVWDEVVAGPPPGSSGRSVSAREVSFLQLSGQPDNYRGEQVSIAGQARTCRKKLLKQTQLPVDHYYEVWVDPIDVDGDGLFCIYAAEIPDAFPLELVEQQSGKFHEVDVPVSLTGRFFKVRSYRDLGGNVSHSPVVITRRIDAAGSATVTEFEPLPSATFSALWFLGIAAVATGLAVVVFRASHSPSRHLGRSSAQRMQRSLEMLEQDQNIKSPAQRVAELVSDEGGQSDGGMQQENDQ